MGNTLVSYPRVSFDFYSFRNSILTVLMMTFDVNTNLNLNAKKKLPFESVGLDYIEKRPSFLMFSFFSHFNLIIY